MKENKKMKKLPAASGKANGHEWINTDTALQNTPLSPKLSPFTLIELLVVIAQYCRNHVKVLYDRIGMQAAGGGALAGNTVNAMNTMNMSAPQKPAMWQKNNKYCTSLRPTGRTSRLTQSSSSHLHTPKAFFTQSAFTLIELLVVIAIIAILAAMLMPALQQAREAAKKADCVSRMKTLGTKFQMYADSQGDWFPYADSGTPKWFSWPMALETSSGRFANLQRAKEHAPSGSSLEWFYKQKYKNVWKDYHCPQQNLMIFESINNLNLGSYVTSYVVNGAVLGGPDQNNGLPLKIVKIIKPGTVGLLCDSIIVQPNTSSYISTAVSRATGLDSEAAQPGFGLIHADTCNILYTDGHVGNTPRAKRLPIAMTESSPYLVHPTRGRGPTNWLLPRN